MANAYYRNRGNYRNYNRRYPNVQHNRPQTPKNIPIDLPPTKDTPLQKDVPPTTTSTPIQDNPSQKKQGILSELLQNNPITSLMNINTNTLDNDKLIILALMYLLYKDGKKNLKLILALGYILI